MKNQQQIVQEEMRKLIKKSCATTVNVPQNFKEFHKTLLKFYFNVADVTLDYEARLISLWKTTNTFYRDNELYELQEAEPVTISYNNLEETLKGCLEHGTNQSRFYKSLLFHYNNVQRVLDNDALSA